VIQQGVRLDRWLWAARFFRTRALAAAALDAGRILVGGQVAKRSRELRLGDCVELHLPGMPPRVVSVRALALARGPAPVARTLYEETAQSLAAREAAAARRRVEPEPATGRPTKRDRRAFEGVRRDWQRWSAALDDDV
jgi:ribosome-associated heat shock protein Hsp15